MHRHAVVPRDQVELEVLDLTARRDLSRRPVPMRVDRYRWASEANVGPSIQAAAYAIVGEFAGADLIVTADLPERAESHLHAEGTLVDQHAHRGTTTAVEVGAPILGEDAAAPVAAGLHLVDAEIVGMDRDGEWVRR